MMAEFREDQGSVAVGTPLLYRLDCGMGHTVSISKDATELSACTDGCRILISQEATGSSGGSPVTDHVPHVVSLGSPRQMAIVVTGRVVARPMADDGPLKGAWLVPEKRVDMNVIPHAVDSHTTIPVGVNRAWPDNAVVGLSAHSVHEMNVVRATVRATCHGGSCG